MKDAFGGIFNLAIISVFLIVVMGILGLTVSYTRAFRAKNIIISRFEQFGSSCKKTDSSCFKKIKADTESITYLPHNLNCPGGYNNADGLYCWVGTTSVSRTGHVDYRYRIITQVDIDIPIINKIMGLYFFQVKGDTRLIEESDF